LTIVIYRRILRQSSFNHDISIRFPFLNQISRWCPEHVNDMSTIYEINFISTK